jgi:hypothetical protein
MAQKRMFDKSVIETDKFLDISLTAKALYFLLGMEADDEGFVSPTRVMRLYGGELGDLKNLIDTGLIIPFNKGTVIVITDWHQNNWLNTNRIKPTQYQNEKKLLNLTESGKYVLSNGLALVKPEERSIEEKRGEYIAPKIGAEGPKSPKKKKMTKKELFSDPTPMTLEEFLVWLKKSPQPQIRVVAEWASVEKPNYHTKGQWSAFLSRNLRPAMPLIGFSDEQLQEAYDRLRADLKRTDPNTGKKVGFITRYTLETLGAYLLT